MSVLTEHAALCQAAFCTPPLSAAAQVKLFSIPHVDWSVLWAFFLAHKASFFVVLEDALSLLPGGATWVDLLKLLESLLAKQNPPTPAS